MADEYEEIKPGIAFDGETLLGAMPCGCQWWIDTGDVKRALNGLPEDPEAEHGINYCAKHEGREE